MTQDDKRTATPTVSIGMPVYNGEKYIREALDSLLAQTFSDFELIIPDNAPTDGFVVYDRSKTKVPQPIFSLFWVRHVVSIFNKDRYKYCFYQIWLFNGNVCSL